MKPCQIVEKRSDLPHLPPWPHRWNHWIYRVWPLYAVCDGVYSGSCVGEVCASTVPVYTVYTVYPLYTLYELCELCMLCMLYTPVCAVCLCMAVYTVYGCVPLCVLCKAVSELYGLSLWFYWIFSRSRSIFKKWLRINKIQFFPVLPQKTLNYQEVSANSSCSFWGAYKGYYVKLWITFFLLIINRLEGLTCG